MGGGVPASRGGEFSTTGSPPGSPLPPSGDDGGLRSPGVAPGSDPAGPSSPPPHALSATATPTASKESRTLETLIPIPLTPMLGSKRPVGHDARSESKNGNRDQR